MRSMFLDNPYGRYDMGRYSGPMFGRPVALNLGCPVSMDEEDHEEVPDLSGIGCAKCRKKHRRTNGRMGQVMDTLTDAAKSAWEGTLSLYGELVKMVPAQAVGSYEQRLKQCQAMVPENPTAAQYYTATKCLQDLYKDIRDGKGAGPVGLPAPAPVSRQEFPMVPVAVATAGLLGLGLVLWKTA